MNFKFQIALIAILIGCVAFVSCERVQNVVLDDVTTEEPMDDTMDDTTDDTMDDTMADLSVVLTFEQPSQEVRGTFQAPGSGFQDYTVVEIDTSAFTEGGMLIIDLTVGDGESAASFDLYDGAAELPTEGRPVGSLSGAYDVSVGTKSRIEYSFEQGQVFKLGATGNWFSEKGTTNDFLAEISVVAADVDDTMNDTTDEMDTGGTDDGDTGGTDGNGAGNGDDA